MWKHRIKLPIIKILPSTSEKSRRRINLCRDDASIFPSPSLHSSFDAKLQFPAILYLNNLLNRTDCLTGFNANRIVSPPSAVLQPCMAIFIDVIKSVERVREIANDKDTLNVERWESRRPKLIVKSTIFFFTSKNIQSRQIDNDRLSSPYGPLNDFYFSTLGLCGPLGSNACFAFCCYSFCLLGLGRGKIYWNDIERTEREKETRRNVIKTSDRILLH